MIASSRRLLATFLVSVAAPVAAFELDVAPAATALLLGEPLVGNMAAGDVGHLAIYATFCSSEGRLHVPFLARLEPAESPFKHYKVTRLASGGLALETTVPPGPNRAAVEQVLELAVTDRCESGPAVESDAKLVTIESVNGLRRLSEVLRNSVAAGTAQPEPDSTATTSQP